MASVWWQRNKDGSAFSQGGRRKMERMKKARRLVEPVALPRYDLSMKMAPCASLGNFSGEDFSVSLSHRGLFATFTIRALVSFWIGRSTCLRSFEQSRPGQRTLRNVHTSFPRLLSDNGHRNSLRLHVENKNCRNR